VDATIRNAEDILGRCGFNPQDIASGIIYIKPAEISPGDR
jgi:hypothetical protein